MLRRKCCSLKAVPYSYPNVNPDEMLSKSIFRGLSFYTINLRVNHIALRKAKIACNFGISECNMVKDVVVAVDEVSFNSVSTHVVIGRD